MTKHLLITLPLLITTPAYALSFGMSLSDQAAADNVTKQIRMFQHDVRESARAGAWTVTPYPESSNGECVRNELGTQWPGLNGYNPGEAEKCQ